MSYSACLPALTSSSPLATSNNLHVSTDFLRPAVFPHHYSPNAHSRLSHPHHSISRERHLDHHAYYTHSIAHTPRERPDVPPPASRTQYMFSQASIPSPPAPATSGYSQDAVHRQDSSVPGDPWRGQYDWAMTQTNREGPVATHILPRGQGLKRGRSYQHTPPAPAVASPQSSPSADTLGPTFPHIASADFSPNSAVLQATFDAASVPKTFQFDPSAFGGNGLNTFDGNSVFTTQQAMQAFAVDQSKNYEVVPEFGHSARQSMSSRGNHSPETPPEGGADQSDNASMPLANGSVYNSINRPPVQLMRTESEAFQDELYNPSVETCPPRRTTTSNSTFLSPHSNIMRERLQAANKIRTTSPGSGLSRERSPFREGAEHAPVTTWGSPTAMSTAASMRQHQKEQAAQAGFAQRIPQLTREPTKTISPKDAELDTHDNHSSLFHDTVPLGYKQHNTGVDTWSQGLDNSTNATFDGIEPTSTAVAGYPADMKSTLPMETYNFGTFANGVGFDSSQMPQAAFQAPMFTSAKANPYLAPSEGTPQFPATLASMESSFSDNGPSSSAEDSSNHNGSNGSTMVQRPADTRANTGSYTCPYHGCVQRFGTLADMQTHKREVHRSQHLRPDSPASPHGSTTASSVADSPSASSPRSTSSPGPTGSGMTSAAIMARNSQAGPHKCTRVNPSTGKPCNTIFSRPYDLTRHEDTIHNARKQKVRCPLCREEKTFSRNDALTRHMRVVHPEVDSYGKRGRRD